MKKTIGLLVILVAIGALMAGSARAATTELPDPTTIITVPAEGPGDHFPATPVPGTQIDWYWNGSTIVSDPGNYERIASLHSDFYAYSAKLNTKLGYSGFDVTPGDIADNIVLYTHNPSTGENLNMLGNPNLDFEDPMFSPAGQPDNSFDGFWGKGNQANGPVFAEDILSYLRSFDPNLAVPVFNFDMNQEGDGSAANVYMAGEVYLWDPNLNGGVGGKVTGADWIFDNNTTIPGFDNPDLNNLSDPGWIPALGDLGIGPYNTDPDFYYLVHHNQGRKLDFIGYAPGMDLSLFEGDTNFDDYQFVAHFKMAGLNDGFETLWLTGMFAPPHDNVIPEPASMSLLGLGLLGLARKLRRK